MVFIKIRNLSGKIKARMIFIHMIQLINMQRIEFIGGKYGECNVKYQYEYTRECDNRQERRKKKNNNKIYFEPPFLIAMLLLLPMCDNQ